MAWGGGTSTILAQKNDKKICKTFVAFKQNSTIFANIFVLLLTNIENYD